MAPIFVPFQTLLWISFGRLFDHLENSWGLMLVFGLTMLLAILKGLEISSWTLRSLIDWGMLFGALNSLSFPIFFSSA